MFECESCGRPFESQLEKDRHKAGNCPQAETRDLGDGVEEWVDQIRDELYSCNECGSYQQERPIPIGTKQEDGRVHFKSVFECSNCGETCMTEAILR